MIFSSITVDYNNWERSEETNAFLRSLILPEGVLLRSSVQEIGMNGQDYYDSWTLVDPVFQSLHSLEVIHWHNNQPILSIILDCLETLNPSAKLHYHIWFYSPQYIKDKDREETKSKVKPRQLVVSPANLYSFAGYIKCSHAPDQQDDLGRIW